jgi:hypothetical protein
MAIQNPQNNQYYKIVQVNLINNQIVFNIYENAEARKEGVTEFHPCLPLIVTIPDLQTLIQGMADATKSIIDNLKVVAYSGVKELPDYQDFIDC